jgi:hypothetical protein
MHASRRVLVGRFIHFDMYLLYFKISKMFYISEHGKQLMKLGSLVLLRC